MTYKIYKIDNLTDRNREQEIFKIIDLNWKDDENIFLSFSFSTTEILECGQWIELYHVEDDETVFYGVITKTNQQNKRELYTYSGYDLGFYFEKNVITIQFKNAEISQAIADTCKKLNFQVGEIPPIGILVSKIYRQQTLKDILSDLYSIAVSKGFEDKYCFDCKKGKLNLLEEIYDDDLRGEIANIYSIKSTDSIYEFEISKSIEELKNRVELRCAGKKDKLGSILTVKEDEDSIKQYGLLQTIEEVDRAKGINVQKMAEKKLKTLTEESNTIKLCVLGNYKLHKNIIVPIKQDLINLDGNYKILNTVHSITGTVERVSFNLSKQKEDL